MAKKLKPYAPSEIFDNPDLVDRIFDYIRDQFPQMAGDQLEKLKVDARAEFGGREHYVASRPQTERQRRVSSVLSLFNGRNATEVARQLQIGRATVYRIIKQDGQTKKLSHLPDDVRQRTP